MPGPITHQLQQFADYKNQILDLRQGWDDFLFYLFNRNGVDIQGQDRLMHLERLMNKLEEEGVGAVQAELDQFERRQDVQDAFRKFCKNRSFLLPADWPNG